MTIVTYIRDTVLIGDVLHDRLHLETLQPGDTVQLVGRQVSHQPGYALRLPGCSVSIVATSYDAAGGRVDVSGTPGLPGAPGAPGATGHIGNDGQSGTNAADGGGTGLAGGSVRLLCENLVDAQLLAVGGGGGTGGAGGSGGNGGPGIPPHPPHSDGVDPGNGGNGGNGATGGLGGGGGHIEVTYVDGGAPQCNSNGGAGGSAGPAGTPGRAGGAGATSGAAGMPGGAGTGGAAGTALAAQVQSADYWSAVTVELGPVITSDWAQYRRRVGEYLYRAETTPVPEGHPSNLELASQEFDRALQLLPGDASSIQFNAQILQGQNVLGLPRDLDIVPEFQLFADAYSQWSSLVFGTYNAGILQLLGATNQEQLTTAITLHLRDLDDAKAVATADMAVAVALQRSCVEDVNIIQQHLDTVTKAMNAAHDAMLNQTMDIGAIVGAVVDVAVAVAAVIAAIPTGGASLVALVPALGTLATTIYSAGPAIVLELFKQDDKDVKAVKDAYSAVSKDSTAILATGKAVINLVSVIEKLEAAKTTSNSAYVELVKQSVDAAHGLLLAQMRKGQADLGVLAVQLRINRAQAAHDLAANALATSNFDVSLAVKTGLAAIDAAGAARDALLLLAFYAQRAVEIYTLKNETGVVQLDSGYIPPDTMQDFIEQPGGPTATSITGLANAYSEAWAKFVQPVKLQTDYLSYFNNAGLGLGQDQRTLYFDDPTLITMFKADPTLNFAVSLADLPATHFNAKVQGVAVSFIGATSASGVTSCEARHAHQYSQLAVDGSAVTQLLRPRTSTIQCPHIELQLAGVNVVPGDPITEPQALSLWGRGVAGYWTLTIPAEAQRLQPTDLSNLTAIQVWISYQFQTTTG